jgi:hypothetical protein
MILVVALKEKEDHVNERTRRVIPESFNNMLTYFGDDLPKLETYVVCFGEYLRKQRARAYDENGDPAVVPQHYFLWYPEGHVLYDAAAPTSCPVCEQPRSKSVVFFYLPISETFKTMMRSRSFARSVTAHLRASPVPAAHKKRPSHRWRKELWHGTQWNDQRHFFSTDEEWAMADYCKKCCRVIPLDIIQRSAGTHCECPHCNERTKIHRYVQSVCSASCGTHVLLLSYSCLTLVLL